MIYLQANTPGQSLFLTLKEGALIFGECSNYLMKILNQSTLQELYVIPQIISENERISHLGINTNFNDPLNSSLEILNTGRYHYTIYGQNNSYNLDPNDSSILGIYEVGYLYILKPESFYTDPSLIIPSDIEYNG
ncbi:hypothetical protein UFOVP386_17 [uncultured Caudovirales phage]|uniref:Uncharacterized protein n=1 Tax=uncultured Caudovirales phage TaxID=2100421 RepID=A0A6J7X0S1_9CAUD|nr:hypothetical protein UFOVP386_17 [uncultured Caudovirales phage]